MSDSQSRSSSKQVNIGSDFSGNLVQGDNNAVINHDYHGEDIGNGLQEVSNAIHESIWQRNRPIYDNREESREIQETVFVAIVSAIAIGLTWNYVYPWVVETTPFFVIATIVLFNILRLTHFGVRHSIRVSTFLSTIFGLLLKNASNIPLLMLENHFVGTALLGTMSAFIGLAVGFVLLFFRPLGD